LIERIACVGLQTVSRLRGAIFMINCKSLLLIAGVLVLAGSTEPARAQLARTFVSSLGNDGNDCNRLTPCRTFQRAHDQTLALGEITVLDPGGYGAVTITKGISIINDGVGEAGALVSGGLNGITINAGPNDRVTLRGITVKGIGFGGGNGIVFTAGRFLSVENCVIRNLTGTAQNQLIGYGIIFNPGTASELAVSHTVVTDNEGHGISVVPKAGIETAAKVRATFSSVQVYKNGIHGIVLAAQPPAFPDLMGAADNVVSANNGFSGFALEGPNGLSLVASRSVASGNGTAFSAVGISFGGITVGQSTVTGNVNAWTGRVFSYGDNYVSFNQNDPQPPPLGIIPRQ